MAKIYVLGAVAVLGLYAFLVFHRQARYNRLVSCQSNLHILRNAASAYASDYDERFPPKPAPGGDWVARRWTASPMEVNFRRGYHLGVAEPGPLWPYLKNCCINRCPSDPDNHVNTLEAGAHSSYIWNNTLCGKLAKDLPNHLLVWDRAPFHDRGRNVIAVSGKPRWVSEKDFAPLLAK